MPTLQEATQEVKRIVAASKDKKEVRQALYSYLKGCNLNRYDYRLLISALHSLMSEAGM